MKEILLKHRLFFLVLLAYAIVLFTGISRTPIFILDEAKNAACAYEMLESGDWIVPTFNGDLRTDKPALHYYFMMTAYSIFGKTPFAARFFSVVFGLLLSFILYYYVRRNADINTALSSVFVLMASLHLSLEFHLAVPDPYLIFFMTLGLLCFYDFIQNKRKIEWFLMVIGLALGTLAKGPVALLLPGLICLIFLLSNTSLFLERLRALKLFWVVVLYAIIVLPWFLMVHMHTHGAWTQGFFFDHNLGRFTQEMEGHRGFIWLPAVMALIGLLPFSWFLIKVIRNKPWKELDSLHWFSFLSGGVILIFFSFSNTQLPNYILPAYPMWAIAIGLVLAKLNLQKHRLFLVFNLIILSTIVTLLIYVGRMDPVFQIQSSWHKILLGVPIFLALLSLIGKEQFSSTKAYVVGSWMSMATIVFGAILPSVTIHDPVQLAMHSFRLNSENSVCYERYSPAFVFYMDDVIEPIQKKDRLFEAIQEQEALQYIITTDRKRAELSELDHLELVFSKKDIFESKVTDIWSVRR